MFNRCQSLLALYVCNCEGWLNTLTDHGHHVRPNARPLQTTLGYFEVTDWILRSLLQG